MDLEALDIARWQFAITTVYHFLFVPITIGLSALVAGYQTAWLRTGNEQWLRMTKFLGKLFLINFALGVVTGIVQEFQFGMNWSDYSRFVGDVFGAPLAVEGLLAFFLESTFLGLWIFGWDRLPRALHASCMWLVHLGTLFSAYFILAANSFMQNPVGYDYNAETGRAELTDFVAVLTNKVQLVTFPHVILAAYMTAGAFVAGVALWHLVRGRGQQGSEDRSMYRSGARVGAWVLLVAGLGVVVVTVPEPWVDGEGGAANGAPGDLPGAGSEGSGDRRHRTHPVGVHDGPLEGLHPAHRPADDGQPAVDPEVVGDRRLAPDHVAHRDGREGRPVRPPRLGVGRGRTGRALTATEDVDAHHEVPVGVDGTARADDAVPPAGAGVAVADLTVGVGVAGEGMAQEDGVVGVRREVTPRLVGHRDRGEHAAALEGERPAGADPVEPPVALGVTRLPGTGDRQVRRVAARVHVRVEVTA